MYFLSIRIHYAIEFSLLSYFFQGTFYNNYSKKIVKALIPVYIIYSVYNYFISNKLVFGSDTAILESLLMIIILVYFFFEKIRYEIQTPLYESKIFWIAVGLFIFFSGNFFLLIYSKSMINDLNFREQYVIIYNSFNIIKNGILCIALIIKHSIDNNRKDSKGLEYPFDNFYPFNNPN